MIFVDSHMRIKREFVIFSENTKADILGVGVKVFTFEMPLLRAFDIFLRRFKVFHHSMKDGFETHGDG